MHYCLIYLRGVGRSDRSRRGGQEFPKIGVEFGGEESWMVRLPFVRTKVIGNVIKIGEIARCAAGAILLRLNAVAERIFGFASTENARKKELCAREVKLKGRATFFLYFIPPIRVP